MTTCVHIAVHGGRSVEVCIYESVLLHHNAKYLLLKVLPVLVYGNYSTRGTLKDKYSTRQGQVLYLPHESMNLCIYELSVSLLYF